MGRPYKIDPPQEAVLLEIVRSDSFATMGEVKTELQRRTGLQVHEQTILKALLRLGVERRKGSDAVQVHQDQAGNKRYGIPIRIGINTSNNAFPVDWRERAGHAEEPTAAVLDAQSPRISP